MENEIWKDVVGYEGLYQVSSEGRVKRIFRACKRTKGLINTRHNKVSLCKNNVQQTYKIDLLVGMAFLPKAPMMECLKHKNGDEKDNRLENLEWENKTMQEKVSELIIKSKFRGITDWKIENNIVSFSLANDDKRAICDIGDWQEVKKYRWYMAINGYPTARIKGKTTCLHWLLMARKDGYVIDHINRDRLDNRRENLRYASILVNCINKNVRNNSTTGHIGVYKLKSGRYHARIGFMRKQVSLGTYNTIEEAINARKMAENKYFRPIVERETFQ